MNNNKNRTRDRKKSNPDLRKMQPKGYADSGMIEGEKIGVHESEHEK